MWCWLIIGLLSVASLGAIVGACRLMEPACCKIVLVRPLAAANRNRIVDQA